MLSASLAMWQCHRYPYKLSLEINMQCNHHVFSKENVKTENLKQRNTKYFYKKIRLQCKRFFMHSIMKETYQIPKEREILNICTKKLGFNVAVLLSHSMVKEKYKYPNIKKIEAY